MNKHQIAPLSPPGCARKADRAVSSPVLSATRIVDDQRDSRSRVGARTPWGWRCYGYLPAHVGQATGVLPVFDVTSLLTCRGRHSLRPFFQFVHFGSQLRRQALADLLPSHFVGLRSLCPQRSDGAPEIVQIHTGEVRNV